LEGSAPPSGVQLSPGFKSPEARKKFFICAGLAAMAVVVLQALLQLWLSSWILPADEPRWAVRGENVHAESVAVWRGPSTVGSGSSDDLWYVAGETFGGFGSPNSYENDQLVHMTEQEPTMPLRLAPGPAWLLAHGETLWIFASDGVSQYDGKEAKLIPAKKLSESASPPFLLDGLPAAVQEDAGVRRVVVLENGQWTEKAQVFLGDAKDAPATDLIKVVAIGDKPYVFCPKGDMLYCREGFPGKDVRFPADWETVGPVGDMWAVVANDGRPEAFTARTEKDKLSVEIVGFARDAKPGSAAPPAATWKQVFSRISPVPLRTFGAATDPAGGCRVVYQTLLLTLNVVQLEGEKLASARRYGDITPADRRWVLLKTLPAVASGILSVALAVVLTGIMKRYRTDSFSGPGRSVQYASLTRRALALLVDAALVLGPLMAGVVGLFWILPGIEDRADARALIYLEVLSLCAMLWAVAAFFILCYTLGRWGRTPGKWAMGIRVLGTELAPCGFARALLRTMPLVLDGLLFISGSLNFRVGALVIACTVNHQRLGDMAARTIVVRETAHAAPVQS
jgi:uncharacterized RDD family membrane protein YckC